MFENLQKTNQPNNSQIDDIFADTDKVADQSTVARNVNAIPQTSASVSPLSTHLPDTNENASGKKGGKGFMIAVVMMSVIILGLLGYLVYSKFFKADITDTEFIISPQDEMISQETVEATTTIETEATTTTETNNEFIDFLPVTPGDNSSSSEGIDLENDTTEEEINDSILPAVPVDSDNDGLTDDEEITLGTNLNIIDTDNDGLSDYEEVNIYQSNPLLVDTDGDSYPDGTEVRGGYDPNVVGGKLPGNI